MDLSGVLNEYIFISIERMLFVCAALAVKCRMKSRQHIIISTMCGCEYYVASSSIVTDYVTLACRRNRHCIIVLYSRGSNTLICLEAFE